MKKLAWNVFVALLLLGCMTVQQTTKIVTPTKETGQDTHTQCPSVNTSEGNWERYKPSSFENLLTTVSQVSHRDSNSEEGIAFYVTTGDSQFPSCIRMEYKDKYREIAEPRKIFFTTIGSMFKEESLQQFVENLQHEALFTENEKEYWIPVYEPLIPYMQQELERNKPVTIFVLWMGTVYVNDQADYAFYIGEFLKEK